MSEGGVSVRTASANGAEHERSELKVIETLADFALGVQLSSVPSEVAHQAALSILDTVGCIVAGATTDEARTLAEVELRRHPSGSCHVVGSDALTSAEGASWINSFSGDVFELNDLTGGHSSIAVVPAALALAEELGSTGAEVLEAVVAGVEVLARMVTATAGRKKDILDMGTAGLGVLYTTGVAAAAARLLKLDRDATVDALRIGAAIAHWCPTEVHFRDGGTIKPLFFGSISGSNGIIAARYAAAGMTGPPGILQSDMGYLTTNAPTWDPGPIRGDSGWFLAQPRRKLHACCGLMHSALDAVVDLRKDGVELGDAESIEVSVHPSRIPLLAKHGRAPTTPNEARFNIEYCLSVVATGADAITPAHSLDVGSFLARPDVRDTMRKIVMVPDETRPGFYDSRVDVIGRDGQRRSIEKTYARGSEDQPLTDDEVRDKFRSLAASVLPTERADAYIARLESLADEESTSWILGDVAGVGHQG